MPASPDCHTQVRELNLVGTRGHGLGVPRGELPEFARPSLVLPDDKNHPKVMSLEEVREILEESVADLTSGPGR